MAPFGKPVLTNANILSSMLKQGFGSEGVSSTKVPTWKPYQYKGKNKLEFTVQERISCVQYDKQNIKDRATISGIILCKVVFFNILFFSKFKDIVHISMIGRIGTTS